MPQSCWSLAYLQAKKMNIKKGPFLSVPEADEGMLRPWHLEGAAEARK